MSDDSACVDGMESSASSRCPPNEDSDRMASAMAAGLSTLAKSPDKEIDQHNLMSSCEQSIEAAIIDVVKPYKIDFNHLLGSGKFAKVYEGTCESTGMTVAIKIVNQCHAEHARGQVTENEEGGILKSISFPGIVKCMSVTNTPSHIVIVTEKLDIDMFEFIVQSRDPVGSLAEADSKFLCFQIVCALEYLHSRKIAHFDLKPENVLLRLISPFLQQVKLADFGYASLKGGNERMRHSLIGTTAYLAPEIQNSEIRAKHGYNFSADLWAFGVIVYVSLCGYFPYREDIDVVKQINQGRLLFTQPIWAMVSSQARSLIECRLLVRSSLRIKAADVLADKWFSTDSSLLNKLFLLERNVGDSYLSQNLHVQSDSISLSQL